MAGCSECNGKGYKKVPKEGGFGFDGSTCDCAVAAEHFRKALSNFEKSGITAKEFLRYPFGSYDVKGEDFTIMDVLKYAYENDVGANYKGSWLYLCGEPGTGKTYRAVLTGMLALAAGHSVYYAPVPDLMDAMRPNRDNDDGTLMQRLLEVDFLIMDDIGKEKVSAWVSERLYMIINGRYRSMKKTILTSNVNFTGLSANLNNPAIMSRLLEMAVEHTLVGEDRRTPDL